MKRNTRLYCNRRSGGTLEAQVAKNCDPLANTHMTDAEVQRHKKVDTVMTSAFDARERRK